MNTGAVLFANNATSRLYASVPASSTSIRVSAGDGAKFPQPLGDGSNWFIVTLEDRRNSTLEICKCTGRSGDILNVVRGQEGTTPQAFEFGASVSNRMTAGMMATFFTFNGYSTTEADARFVNATGDAMTGPLGLPGAPTTSNQAATKQYVDDVSIDEAPTDGRAYGRQSIAWVPIAIGMTEPPVDGIIYGRQDLAWAQTITKPTFDAEVTARTGADTALDTRVTANETKNTTQDNRLTAVEGVNTAQDTTLAGKQDLSQKGQVNGYASLDASAKVPAVQLPAYVDDVLEFANQAAFPATGVAGIIYVALDTNKTYRWGGSSYTEISPSPGSTDAVPEGSVNKYYTDARAQAALTASLALKANLASPTFTGDPQAPTPATADNDTSIATTAFVKAQAYAPLASPAFTGNPVAPTPTAGDNDTSIATTAFVATALSTIVGGAIIGDVAPSSPKPGQLWWESDSGNTFIWYDDGTSGQWVQINTMPAPGATADARNRFVNPAMQVSQEVGDAGTAFLATHTGYYVADQWNWRWGLSPGTAAAARQGNVISPNGSIRAAYITIGTAKAVLAAGDYTMLTHTIEQTRLLDLQWGTAAAIPVVLRFWVFTTLIGKYSCRLYSADAGRGYVHQFDILAANTWTLITVAIPGDTTSGWFAGASTTLGMTFDIVAVCGSTWVGGVADAWQSGTFYALPGQTNLAGTAGAAFRVADLGLYADPNRTGLPPPWQAPDEVQELQTCMRYWQLTDVQMQVLANAAGQSFQMSKPTFVPMRVAPSETTVNAGSFTNAASVSIALTGGRSVTTVLNANAAGLVGVFNRVHALNARM